MMTEDTKEIQAQIEAALHCLEEGHHSLAASILNRILSSLRTSQKPQEASPG
jgi:hypothetical protein